MAGNKKAGPVTLALGLIFFGCVLLIANFTGTGVLTTTLKFWPVLLVGLGVEYFIRGYINRKNSEGEGARFHFPTVIVILLVAFIGYSLQQATALFKNRELNSFVSEAIAGANYNYKHDFEYKPLTVRAGVTKVVIDNPRGKVDLAPSPDGKLHVRAHIVAWGPTEAEAKRRAEMVKVNIEEGDVINISRTPERNYNIRHPAEVAYRIMVPKGVSVATEKGVNDLRADSLDADLDIKADGSIVIRDAARNVLVASEGGRVDVSSNRPVKANYDITSKFGEITLRIPGNSDARVSARTQHGSIDGSLNLKTEKLTGPNQAGPGHETAEPDGVSGVRGTVTLGSGKGSINLNSENGNIIVEKN